MARQRKGVIFNLFKNHFKITFYHKPTMLENDIYHVIILDDIIRLKIRITNGVLIVDDAVPLTVSYLSNIYDQLIEIFIKQTNFTILISLTGNTISLESACIKAEAPIIEDPRFTCLPDNLYDELKKYYRNDTSKYGFYLLAVNEQNNNSNNQNTKNEIRPGNIPIIETIQSCITKLFPTSKKNESIVLYDYSDWKKGKVLSIRGIQFRLTFDEQNNIVGLSNFYLNEMQSFQDLIKLCKTLEQYSEETSIILYDVTDPLVKNICEVNGYKNISHNFATPCIRSNQSYIQATYGDYKISNKIIS